MSFWELAFEWGWATTEQLREVVKYGEITEEDFKRITGEDYAPAV